MNKKVNSNKVATLRNLMLTSGLMGLGMFAAATTIQAQEKDIEPKETIRTEDTSHMVSDLETNTVSVPAENTTNELNAQPASTDGAATPLRTAARASSEDKIVVNIADETTQTEVTAIKAETGNPAVTAEDSSYSGTVEANISINDLLKEANEYYKKNEALAGPRTMFSEEGSNLQSQPHIDYTYQIVGDNNAKIVSTTQSENAATIVTIKPTIADDGKSVTFRIEFPWWSYNQFFPAYEKDIPNNPVLNLSIHYEGTAPAGSKYEDVKASIQGSGGGNLTYSKWGTRLFVMTIGTDTVTLPLYTAEVPPAPDTYTLPAPDTYTLPNQELEGDLLIGEDTQHDSVPVVKPGQVLDYTGSLDITPIQEQIQAIQKDKNIPDTELEKIGLENTSSTFTAELTLPDGLSYSQPLSRENVQLVGANGNFTIEKVEQAGQKVTVTMVLREGITNFKELKEAVLGVDGQLKVVVPGVKVSESALNKEQYTVKGSLRGSMSSLATYNGRQIQFQYDWQAKQSEAGRDYIQAGGGDDIQLTVEVERAPDPTPSENVEQPKSGENTETKKDNYVPRHAIREGKVHTGSESHIIAPGLGLLTAGLGFAGLVKKRKDED